MGKHKLVKNLDPIIKKDYRVEKRKKIRAQEKEDQRRREQQEEKEKGQIAKIEHEVEEEIKRQVLLKAMENKHKAISKMPKGLLKSSSGPMEEDKNNRQLSTMGRKNKEHIILKEAGQIDNYQEHFQELPSNISLIRWMEESRKDVIDRQVRGEIRQMFREKGEGEESEGEKGEKEEKGGENEYSHPYNLVKQKGSEKEILIKGEHSHLLSHQAYGRKEKLMELGDVRRSIIDSYSDFIHIENKEEETIEAFRSIVIEHMVRHEQRCRAQSSLSKGFNNAKSVILCPYFGDARAIIEALLASFPAYTIINQEKIEEVEDQNDFFRIGISVNDKKQSIKLFSHFNVSNFLIASPVGLKAIVGGEGESNRDYSFLSSVEILYVDRASTIFMQNWGHLIEVIKNMNLMPSSDSICNSIDHLRASVPELKGRLYRQTIVFSEFNLPEINGLKHLHLHNWEGCVTSKVVYNRPAVAQKIQELEKQFFKLDLKQAKEDLEMRSEFFKRKFWDEIHNSNSMNKVVIFVRSYFEFIWMKEFLSRVNASAECISEHTKKPKVQQRIHHFNTGSSRILLLSERAYYYGVCQIKKLQHLYFYSLPVNSFIFHELVSEVVNSYTKNKIVTIYSKYDMMTLERIVGTFKAQEMIRQFCSNVSFIL